MQVDNNHRALYSVVEGGGQNQFIDPQGRGNPHLTDQTMMHGTTELKKIPLQESEVRATAASMKILKYEVGKK